VKFKTMTKMKAIYITMVLLSLVACTGGNSTADPEAELMEADRAFSAMSEKQGMNEAFLGYCSEEAVLLRENSMPLEGKSAIAARIGNTDDSGFVLTWEPAFARVAGSGELGYTYGLYTLVLKEPDTTLRGTYVSVWARENGEWRWVLDSGNEGLGS